MEQKSEKDVMERKNTYFDWFVIAVMLLLIVGFTYFYGVPPFTVHNYSELFVTLTIWLIVVLIIQYYRFQNIDKIVIGYTLFGIGGLIALFSNNTFLISFYNSYPVTLHLSLICAVGIISILTTQRGFFAETFEDKKLVHWLSLKLLFWFLINALCAFYFEYKYGVNLFAWLITRWPHSLLYQRYIDQLKGKKKGSWAFKWKY